MVRSQHPQLRELARRVDELSAPESQTGEQTEIGNALFRLANEDETWEKAFGWVLSECVPTRELVKNAATVGDTVRWLKGRVETAERLERETAKSAPVSPADPVPLNAVRAAIEAISTGRPANALENLRVLEMHLRAQSGVVPMILHCPRCRMQHIDEPWHPGLGCRRERDNRDLDRGGTPISIEAWQNPPHRSHLCAGCGFIWRPADVPTTGVAAITTRGQSDTDSTSMPVFSDVQVERAARTPMLDGAPAWAWVFGGGGGGGGREITQDHLDWFRRVLSFGACGVLANPERDRSLAAAQEGANGQSAELQEFLRQKRSEKPGEPT